ncbi:MAG: potassium-transporting ATPase subunit KdpC [Comamonas sp.]
MKTLIRPAISLLLVLTVATGGLYPAVVTGLAQGLFPHQAHGSLVVDDGRAVGSELIGQNFGEPKYFWPRPSATSPEPYNAANSGGSNLGPLNPALQEAVRARIEALKAADLGNVQPVPVDLVTASASGLDPHISVAAARYQAARVARVRQLPASTVDALVAQHTEAPLLGFLGEERVNVLALNRALDRMAPR